MFNLYVTLKKFSTIGEHEYKIYVILIAYTKYVHKMFTGFGLTQPMLMNYDNHV